MVSIKGHLLLLFLEEGMKNDHSLPLLWVRLLHHLPLFFQDHRSELLRFKKMLYLYFFGDLRIQLLNLLDRKKLPDPLYFDFCFSNLSDRLLISERDL